MMIVILSFFAIATPDRFANDCGDVVNIVVGCVNGVNGCVVNENENGSCVVIKNGFCVDNGNC